MNESTTVTSTWSTSTPIMTKNISQQQPLFVKTPIHNATLVILFFVIIGIVLGNILVLVTTWLDKCLHQPSKYFIACLAVADLLVGVFSVLIRLYMYFHPLQLYPINLCRFWIWMDTFCVTASIVTLTVISADRYFKICQPFKYRVRMDTKTFAIVIVIIWLISAISATFCLFSFGNSGGITAVVARGCLNEKKIYFTIVSVVFFFVPLIIIIFMYAFIFSIAHQRQKMYRRGGLGQSFSVSKTDETRKDLRQQFKTVRMLSLVVCTFIFCWAPFFILILINYHKIEYFNSLPSEDFQIIFSLFVVILPAFNSLCNPLVYACFDREYGNAFKHLLEKYIVCTFLSRQNTRTGTGSNTRRTNFKEKGNNTGNLSSPRLMFELRENLRASDYQCKN